MKLDVLLNIQHELTIRKQILESTLARENRDVEFFRGKIKLISELIKEVKLEIRKDK